MSAFQGGSPLRHHFGTAPYPTLPRPVVPCPSNPRGGETTMPKSGKFPTHFGPCCAHRADRGRRSGDGRRVAGQAHGHHDQRRRKHLRLPARHDVDSGRRFPARLRAAVQRNRLERRHQRHHRPHGRLRRERRSAVPRSVQRLQRLRSDPMGARRYVGHVQPPRREEPPAHGRSDAGEDLHGSDHDVG